MIVAPSTPASSPVRVDPGSLVLFDEDRWLSDVLARPAYRVHLAAEAAPDALRRAFEAHGAAGAFYTLKVDASAVPMVEALRSLGFYVADVNVTLSRRPEPARPPGVPDSAPTPAQPVMVGPGEPSQVSDVLDVAGHCFRYSRFHLDPYIPQAVAHRVKREWVRSYVEGRRGDGWLVATRGGEVAGFLAWLDRDDAGCRIRVIDLMGVSERCQRQGVGRALVRTFVEQAGEAIGRLEVGTQAANIPSLALYIACGFVPVRTQFVLHAHDRMERAEDRT